MNKLKPRLQLFLLLVATLGAMTLPVVPINAEELTNRRLRIDSSVASTTTSYEISFSPTSLVSVGSIVIEFCQNSTLFDVACVPPPGFDASSASLDTQTGETGFSIHGDSNQNKIILTRAPSVITGNPVSYEFSDITNPSTEGTHYARISLHASTDGSGGRIDDGGVAFIIHKPVGVDAYVPPILTFCVGTNIAGLDCSSASGSNIDLGVLSATSTKFASTQMVAGTNAVGGYSITLSGTTMTSGNNTISALAVPTASTAGQSQFGVNLRLNTIPPIGDNVSGPGTGAPTAGYSVANQYQFVTNDVIAGTATSSELNKYTVSYIVNIGPNQPPGVYSTTLTYICLANF